MILLTSMIAMWYKWNQKASFMWNLYTFWTEKNNTLESSHCSGKGEMEALYSG